MPERTLEQRVVAEAATRPSTRLLYFFILGDVLGAGVYVLVGQVAAASGGAAWVPLLTALLTAAATFFQAAS
ncbi:hypothetical protein ACH4OH_27170 [Streptomyces albidoflavus]